LSRQAIQRAERQRGFTMIELMIAVLVVSIAMLAMVSMLDTDMRTNQTSERRMDASAMTQSILQEAVSRASVADYPGVALTSQQPAPGGETFYQPLTRFGGSTAATAATAVVTITSIVGGLTFATSQAGSASHVRVVLNWQERGVPKQVELRGQAVTQ